MRKAIQLKATIQVTGEAEANADFATAAMAALRKVIKAGDAAAPDLKFTVKRVIENRDDGEEETDESGGADASGTGH